MYGDDHSKVSEFHDKSPRINSCYSFAIYDVIVEISRQINFNHKRFNNRMKRNLSLGSVQSFIVELALSNDNFREYLKEFMINEGKDWHPKKITEFEKYSSPADLRRAKERFNNSVDSRDMYIDRDKRKLIDPTPAAPKQPSMFGVNINTNRKR